MARALRRLAVAQWVLARAAVIAGARALAWCADDPARLRTVIGGVLACAAVGAALGFGAGQAVAAVVRLVTGLLPSTAG